MEWRNTYQLYQFSASFPDNLVKIRVQVTWPPPPHSVEQAAHRSRRVSNMVTGFYNAVRVPARGFCCVYTQILFSLLLSLHVLFINFLKYFIVNFKDPCKMYALCVYIYIYASRNPTKFFRTSCGNMFFFVFFFCPDRKTKQNKKQFSLLPRAHVEI